MTASILYIGQSTAQISFLGTGNTFANFASAIADVMAGVQPGVAGDLSGITPTVASSVQCQPSTGMWSLYDSFWGGQNATTGVASPVYTQVFRNLNADGITYKFVIMRYMTTKQEINITTCEFWNATTHVATNEAWTYLDSAPIGYSLAASDIILCVSPRWCILHGYINNEPCLWAGVVESKREDPNDTAAAGYPCWSWVSSTLELLGAATVTAKPIGGTTHTLCSFPRLRNGAVGSAASLGMSADYGNVTYPNWLNTTNGAFCMYLGSSFSRFQSSGWNLAARSGMYVKPIIDYDQPTVIVYGEMYGYKTIAPSGINMAKIDFNVDIDGCNRGSGVLRKHWLLNKHHKVSTTVTTWFLGNTSWSVSNQTVSTGIRPESMASTGMYYYCICQLGAKVCKVSAASGASLDVLVGGGYTDIQYDGERYMYVSSTVVASALTRIDTWTDTTAVATGPTGGYLSIALNGSHVAVTPYATVINPSIARYIRQSSTGTVSPLTTVAAAATPTMAEAVRLVNIVSDFEGNFFASAHAITQAANDKLVKIPALVGGAVSLVACNGIARHAGGLYMIDGDNLLVSQYNAPTALNQSQYNPRTGAVSNNRAMVNSSITILALVAEYRKIQTIKFEGVLMTMVPNPLGTAGSAVAMNSLATTTGILATPSSGGDLAVTAIAACTPATLPCPMIFHDGARIISNTATQLRIWTNVHGGISVGGNPISGVTLGQLAIAS